MRWRVTAGASVVLALTLVVTAMAAAGLLRRALTADEESVLVDRVDTVEQLIDSGLLGAVVEPTGAEVSQVQVVDATGALIAQTRGLPATARLDVIPAPPVDAQRAVTVDGEEVGGAAGTQYRVVARTVDTLAGPWTIYAATPTTAAHRAERYLRNSILLVIPLLVLVTAWFIGRVVSRALAPVEAMRLEVDRIEAHELSTRVAAGASDDEIAKLGDTLNRMLERLEDAARRQELFAASASHELRSPLSAIRTELEVGLAYPDRADWPTIAADSLIELGRLEGLSRDLRMLTRSRTGAAVQRFDLTELVAAEVGRRRPAHPIRLGPRQAAAAVLADRDGVVQVVRNLLDNADRHAATEVGIEVVPDATGVTLVVTNDGEPIPPGMHERIFDAFTRLDEARSLDAGGSGLGLAIARALMQANGGTLTAPESERGAAFRAWFPAPPADGGAAPRPRR